MRDQMDQLLTAYERGKLTRRQLLSALALTGTSSALALSATPVSAQQKAPVFRARSINHLGVSVSNMRRSGEFYRQVFGLPPLRALAPPGDGTFALDVGDSFISLSQRGYGRAGGDPTPNRVGLISHFCLGIDNFEAKRATDALRAAGVEVTQERSGESVLVRDPDGLMVQISGHKNAFLCPTCPKEPPA